MLKAVATSAGGGGGVTTIDGISGAVTLVAGANITITDNSPVAGDITIAAALNNLLLPYVPPVFPQYRTCYVTTTGNDSTGTRGNPALPFLTIAAALAATTTPGDCINIGAGTFALGNNNINLFSGAGQISLVGAGAGVTIITSTAFDFGSGAKGTIIGLDNNSYVGHLTIQGLNGGSSTIGVEQSGIGGRAAFSQQSFTGAVIDSVTVTGCARGLFASALPQSSVDVYNSTFNASRTAADISITFTSAINIYSSTINAVASAGNTAIIGLVSGNEGAVNVFGGTVNASGGSSSNVAVETSGSSNATISLFNTTLSVSGSGSHSDIFNNGNVPVVLSNVTGSGTGGAPIITGTGGAIYSNHHYLNAILGDTYIAGLTQMDALLATQLNGVNATLTGQVTAQVFADTNGDNLGFGTLSLQSGSIYLNNGNGFGGNLFQLDGGNINGSTGGGFSGGAWNLDAATLYGSAQSSGQVGGVWNMGDGSGYSGATGGTLNGDGGNITNVANLYWGPFGGYLGSGGNIYMGEGNVDYVNNINFYTNSSFGGDGAVTWPTSAGPRSQLYTDQSNPALLHYFDGSSDHVLGYTGGGLTPAGSSGNLQTNNGSGGLGYIPSPGGNFQVPTFDSSGAFNSWQYYSSATGTVTSVGLSSSTLTLGGTNPVTGSGTITVDYYPMGGFTGSGSFQDNFLTTHYWSFSNGICTNFT